MTSTFYQSFNANELYSSPPATDGKSLGFFRKIFIKRFSLGFKGFYDFGVLVHKEDGTQILRPRKVNILYTILHVTSFLLSE